MIGYAATERFPSDLMRDRIIAERIVAALPDKDENGEWIRCHEVARVVASRLPPTWTVVDGYYATCDHSWLRSPAGLVLDTYAVAVLPIVQLVDTYALFNRNRYRSGQPRRDIRKDVLLALQQVLDRCDTLPRVQRSDALTRTRKSLSPIA